MKKTFQPVKRLIFLAIGVAALSSAFAQPAPKKITLAVATRDIDVSHAFATIPLVLGYYKDEGLDVTIIPGQNSSTAIQLLTTKRADITLNAAQTVMLQKVKSGLPLVSFYALSRYSSNQILVNPESPIKSVKQLKGKKVGVIDLAGNAALFLKMKLQESGLAMSDIELISTGYGTPAAEALKTGAIDAQVDFTGNIVRKEAAGYKMRYLDLPGQDSESYSFNFFTREDYLAANPDVIQRFGRAIAKVTVFIKTNPEAAVKAYWKQFPDRAPKDLNDRQAMARDLKILGGQSKDMGLDKLPTSFPWGKQLPSVFEDLQNDLIATQQIDKKLNPDVFFTDKFTDFFNTFDRNSVEKEALGYK